MKKLIILLALSVLFFSACQNKIIETEKSENTKTSIEETQNITTIITQEPMKITSSAFSHNQKLPAKYTCDGSNINPPLTISDIPEGAKSLVLIHDDPDAPMGIWVHWTLWNINPATLEIAENSVPNGAAEGMTSFRKTGYGGACPPSGTHRYFFKIYALDTTLNLSSSAKSSDIESAMEGHILAKAELIGLYR